MSILDDTIVAIATAAGRGGLGVVRISGSEAPSIAAQLIDRHRPLQPRRATFARLRREPTASCAPRDEVVVTWFRAPASFTGQHVVEISAHGSPVVLNGIVRRAVDAGARLARPGEFTLRAFLNGKRDLVQAEAVADLVEAATPLQARAACDQLDGTLSARIRAIDAGVLDLVVPLEASLDFPDEGYHFVQPGDLEAGIAAVVAQVDALLAGARRGRMIREGARVVIAGRTNVGKSSLFNALAGAERAIVTPVPGTTRDLVTERIDLDGLEVTLVDTAGTRETIDVVEREGVARGARARSAADLVLLVLDGSEPPHDEDVRLLDATQRAARIVVINKKDCGIHPAWPEVLSTEHLTMSALSGDGLDALRTAVTVALSGGESLHDPVTITNVRHIDLLQRARAHLMTAAASARERAPEEFVLSDLHAAGRLFDEVVGARTTDDLLEQVFSRFCIGK